jgi:hypothetical protein
MKYLKKYIEQRCDKSLEVPKVTIGELDLIIVIPAYNESLESIIETIKSLCSQCQDTCSYAVFLLINTHIKDNEELIQSSLKNYQILKDTEDNYKSKHRQVNLLYHHFTTKKSGVGHARKLLMDTAFRYFHSIGKNGIIVNLDADTTVADNYIQTIYKHFDNHNDTEAGSIRYEHKILNENHPIIDYELHLRYFINMQRLIHLPYGYQTVGSAMAVRSQAYAKEGGMNKKQAGEDFYFMHKYSKTLKLSEINDTVVFPSSRISDRVPFGTGRAISEASKESYEAMSYNYDSFLVIGEWIAKNLKVILNTSAISLNIIKSSSDTLNEFLRSINAEDSISNIMRNSHNQSIRYKSFFAWFNAFQLMKSLHFLRDKGYKDQSIDICTKKLLETIEIEHQSSRKANLELIREYDRHHIYKPSVHDFL